MTDIQMTGIDHSTAGVKIREQFSFTVLQAERALQKISSQKGVHGCVLLSTCNRMELYASMETDSGSLLELFKKVGPFSGLEDPYDTYFKIRRQEEAVRHLFYLTAGLKSRILGEDQILTQVREAVKQSRELYCTDPVLEVLFRQAVTAGKEVKTKAMSGYADMSAVHCALAYIRQKGFSPEGKKCLVIGNGKMGKLAAETLLKLGCARPLFLRIGSKVPGESDKRGDGFESVFRQRGMECAALRLSDEDGLAPFRDFLAGHMGGGRLAFDGIFCVNDALAIQIRAMLLELGLRVPEDVQLIGFDGIRRFAQDGFYCSTIVQPVARLAETSVDLLLREDRSNLPSLVCLPVAYAAGGTTQEP